MCFNRADSAQRRHNRIAPRLFTTGSNRFIYLCNGRSPQSKGFEKDGRMKPLDINIPCGSLVGGIDHPVGQHSPCAQQDFDRGKFKGKVLMKRGQIDRNLVGKPVAAGAIARIFIGRIGMGVVATGQREFEAYHAVGVVMVREYRRKDSQATRQQQNHYFQPFSPHTDWFCNDKGKPDRAE